MPPSKAMSTTESAKTAFIGFLAGGIAVSPITYLHNFIIPGEIITNPLSQFEFDTLTGAISGAAFAMLYRYFVQEEKDDMLANGVIAAFVIAKTFSRVKVSYYCDGLVCGDPVDFSMFQQSLLGGVENVILFVAVAIAIEALEDISNNRAPLARWKKEEDTAVENLMNGDSGIESKSNDQNTINSEEGKIEEKQL
jgi:hypothetical protein